MTWPAAYRIADQQIAYWQRSGVAARAATIEGVTGFNYWWKTQSKEDKELLRAFKGEYDRLAATADAQRGLAL